MSLRSTANLFKHPASHALVDPYWRLMRLDKPIGTLLILWPTLAALWIAAEGLPSLSVLLIFVVGTFLMRAAGCAINDFADRDFDGAVERTTSRPLATGELPAKHALYCFVVLAMVAFVLVLFTNPLTIKLSFVGAALAGIYPFLKRVTHLPQVWLGLAMNWGMVMAYSAQTGTLHPAIGVFYVSCVLWTVVYDCFYAMIDRDDDLKLGLKSIAILFGEQDRMITAMLQVLVLWGLYITGQRFELNAAYFVIALFGCATLFLYQQWLIRSREKEGCFKAFLNNQWVGFTLFVSAIAGTY